MNIHIGAKKSRDKSKTWYYFEWGKASGERKATGIFTFTKPKDPAQKAHNKEALHLLEVKRSHLILDQQSIGSGYIPAHKFESNFLKYYAQFIESNKREGNRHLEGSLV